MPPDSQRPSSQRPSLSIVTPVFDTPAAYIVALADALEGIADGGDVEWIVVDDGSTDPSTCTALAALQDRQGVRVVANAASRGAAGARNFGVRETRADWLYFIDADDLPVPGALDTMRALLAANPQVRWLSGDFVDFDGEVPSSDMATSFGAQATIRHWPDAANRLVTETWVNQGSYLIARELFSGVGGFDTAFVIGEDWLMWMRLAVREELYFVDMPVLWRRRGHASTMSGPLSLSDAIVRPYLTARRDPQFRAQRRFLRWRIVRLYQLLARRNQEIGRTGQATRFALLAACWSLRSPRDWLDVLKAAVGRRLD
ncbi:MAG: glycosyltransferase [Chromatiaceae bacterium]|nr:glycosyltransferase [Chromatiaceae bacterium]